MCLHSIKKLILNTVDIFVKFPPFPIPQLTELFIYGNLEIEMPHSFPYTLMLLSIDMPVQNLPPLPPSLTSLDIYDIHDNTHTLEYLPNLISLSCPLWLVNTAKLPASLTYMELTGDFNAKQYKMQIGQLKLVLTGY